MALLSLLALVAAASAVLVPKVKWSQTVGRVHVTAVMKDLARDSVAVDFSEEGLKLTAKDTKGKDFALDLVLREDIDPSTGKWELLSKKQEVAGYRGDCVHVTVAKAHAHAWSTLVDKPAKYKSVKFVRVWEDDGKDLDVEEEGLEDTYASENRKVFGALKKDGLAAALEKTPVIVANMRYSWCKTCQTADKQFVEAARAAKKRAKTDAKWQAVSFATIDAREDRAWSRSLGVSCEYPCGYR